MEVGSEQLLIYKKIKREKPETRITMSKIDFKPGNMLYPLPAVLISCGTKQTTNLFTVAWAGTVCTNPPMVSISVRPERYSYDLIRESKEFAIN